MYICAIPKNLVKILHRQLMTFPAQALRFRTHSHTENKHWRQNFHENGKRFALVQWSSLKGKDFLHIQANVRQSCEEDFGEIGLPRVSKPAVQMFFRKAATVQVCSRLRFVFGTKSKRICDRLQSCDQSNYRNEKQGSTTMV